MSLLTFTGMDTELEQLADEAILECSNQVMLSSRNGLSDDPHDFFYSAVDRWSIDDDICADLAEVTEQLADVVESDQTCLPKSHVSVKKGFLLGKDYSHIMQSSENSKSNG